MPWSELQLSHPLKILYRLGAAELKEIPQIPSTLPEDARDFVLRCLERCDVPLWPAGIPCELLRL